MRCCIYGILCFVSFFFFKQKTAYEMRISDWSSDVCSSDLLCRQGSSAGIVGCAGCGLGAWRSAYARVEYSGARSQSAGRAIRAGMAHRGQRYEPDKSGEYRREGVRQAGGRYAGVQAGRSEEHTSELQSLMRTSYAVFCLTKTQK